MEETKSSTRQIYFVLPIYNEEAALGSLLETLAATKLPCPSTIVAINDGSKDRSAAILEEAASKYPIKIITHNPNRGIPGVFKSALEYLVPILNDDDTVIIMESDHTSDPSLIPQLVERIAAGCDIVIASRHVAGGAYVRFPWFRTAASSLVNLALQILLRLPDVEDYTIFYRAYRGALLKKGFGTGEITFKARRSFAVNGELLLILAAYKPRIEEIPMRYDYGLKTSPSSMPLFATLLEYGRLASIYTFKKPGH